MSGKTERKSTTNTAGMRKAEVAMLSSRAWMRVMREGGSRPDPRAGPLVLAESDMTLLLDAECVFVSGKLGIAAKLIRLRIPTVGDLLHRFFSGEFTGEELGEVMRAQTGGGSVYSALGIRLWGHPVGINAVVGHDYPAGNLETLETQGVSTEGIRRISGDRK